MKCRTLLPSPEQNFHLEELAMSTHCNCLNRNNHKMFQRHPRQNRHLECSILILNQMALNILHFRDLILENILASKTKWSLSVIDYYYRLITDSTELPGESYSQSLRQQ